VSPNYNNNEEIRYENKIKIIVLPSSSSSSFDSLPYSERLRQLHPLIEYVQYHGDHSYWPT